MLVANGKITTRQLQILIVLSAMGTGVIILPRRVAEFAGQDGWVIVLGLILVAMGIGLLMATAIGQMAKVKPGVGFMGSLRHMLSTPVAYVIGILLWLKLVFAAGLELRAFLEITQMVMLPATPIPAVSVAVILLCAYAAAKGIETRARVAEILFAIMAIPFVFLVGLAIFDIDFTNLMPVLVTPPQSLLHGVLRLGFIFTGLECLLLVAPFVKGDKKLGWHIAKAILFAGGIIFLITILTIAKFGHGVVNQPWPVLRMMDMINLPGSFIERQEVLMFSFWIITAFAIGNTMLFFGGVLIKDMFRPKVRHMGVIITAVATFAISIFPWEDIYGVLDAMYLTAGIFFLLVLPVVIILGAKIKRVAPAGLVLLLLLTGCFDKVEIEDRAFVVAMAVDRVGEDYAISVSIPLIKKDVDSENEEPPHIKTATAPTIAQALKTLDAEFDKTLYYGQAKLLILGEDLLTNRPMAEKAIHTLAENKEIDLRINVVAYQGDPVDILHQKPPGESLSGLFVADIYKHKDKLGGTSFALDLERLSNAYPGGAVVPLITPDLKLEGAWANGQHLDKEAMQGFLWCKASGNKDIILAVPVNGQLEPITIKKHQVKTSFTQLGNGQLQANINIEVTASQNPPALGHIIRQQAQSTFDMLQFDAYSWLDQLRKTDYKLYQTHREHWHDVFNHMVANIQVNIKTSVDEKFSLTDFT